MIGFDSQPYFVRIPLLFSAKLHKAGIAQLVEHHLAKVEVASSSLVSRSIYPILSFQRTISGSLQTALFPWKRDLRLCFSAVGICLTLIQPVLLERPQQHI